MKEIILTTEENFHFPPKLHFYLILSHICAMKGIVEFGIPTAFGLLSKLTELSFRSYSMDLGTFPSLLGMLTDLETP